jgi:hypothetical protein
MTLEKAAERLAVAEAALAVAQAEVDRLRHLWVHDDVRDEPALREAEARLQEAITGFDNAHSQWHNHKDRR